MYLLILFCTSFPATRCSDLYTCRDCSSHPACGWCNDPSNTGLGKCVEGSASGPMTLNKTSGLYALDTAVCKAEQWHFIDCPRKFSFIKIFNTSENKAFFFATVVLFHFIFLELV